MLMLMHLGVAWIAKTSFSKICQHFPLFLSIKKCSVCNPMPMCIVHAQCCGCTCCEGAAMAVVCHCSFGHHPGFDQKATLPCLFPLPAFPFLGAIFQTLLDAKACHGLCLSSLVPRHLHPSKRGSEGKRASVLKNCCGKCAARIALYVHTCAMQD